MTLTAKCLRKLQEKLAVIERLKRGERKRDVARDPNVTVSERVIHRWWKVYTEEGIEGLVDKRKGMPYKITEEMQDFILQEGAASTPGREIAERVKTIYGAGITDRQVNKILAKSGLSNPVGRPKRKYKMIDCVGAFFLRGADLEMGLSDVVLDVTKDSISRKDDSGLIITHSKESTISHKNNTLLYMPVFGLKKPWGLQKDHKRCLGVISESGKRYRYSTMEKYLSDLEKLEMERELSKRLAKCYQEVWYFHVSLEDGDAFYIDGHMKALWSSKNIPKGYHTTRHTAMKCVEQFFIHGNRGHPLILETCAGDTHLTRELFKLIDAFEQGVGRKIVEVSVFDREGLSVELFREFERKKRFFITLLRSDQYKSEDSFEIIKDFETFEVDDVGKPVKLVADARFELKYSEYDEESKRHERKYPVRVALIKKVKNDKLIPVITNIRHKKWTAAKIAKTYFERWPNQENQIKGLVYGVNLDVNHGYRKIEVTNRVVDRKKQKLEKNISAIERKIKSSEEKLGEINRRSENAVEKYQGRIKKLDDRKETLKSKVIAEDDVKRKEKYFEQIDKVDEKIMHFTKKHHELLERLKIKKGNILKYREDLLIRKENKEKKLASLDSDKKLYEAKTSKDMVMSNFKIMLNNMHIYARDHYFSEEYHNKEFETMCSLFYRQEGYIKVTKDCYNVMLSSYDDQKLQEEAKRACARFNERDIHTKDGRKIRIETESMTF